MHHHSHPFHGLIRGLDYNAHEIYQVGKDIQGLTQQIHGMNVGMLFLEVALGIAVFLLLFMAVQLQAQRNAFEVLALQMREYLRLPEPVRKDSLGEIEGFTAATTERFRHAMPREIQRRSAFHSDGRTNAR